MLFKNEKYEVSLPEGATKYIVKNIDTGVIEFEGESLPRCVIVAQESEAALSRLMPKEEAPSEANVIRLR